MEIDWDGGVGSEFRLRRPATDLHALQPLRLSCLALPPRRRERIWLVLLSLSHISRSKLEQSQIQIRSVIVRRVPFDFTSAGILVSLRNSYIGF
jgi:hypothetical protein